MKLKQFLDFTQKFNVIKVLHSDPLLSGYIKDVDYDDKKVTIQKEDGNNRVLKLNTFLATYQMVLSKLGSYVRLGSTHEYKYEQEVLYIKGGSSYSNTKGKVTKVTNSTVTVEWTHGESYDFGNDSSLKNILFVGVKTQEEINMEAYAVKMKKIAEENRKPNYFLYAAAPDGTPMALLCAITANGADEAKSVIPPIYKYCDTVLLLKVGGQ